MHWLRRGSRVRQLISLLQLAIFLSGCLTWRAEPAAPAELVSKKPSLVRVTLPDSSHVVLNDPLIRSDTLYGYRQLPDQSRAVRAEGIPLGQVKDIALLRSDPTKNTLIITGFAVALFSTLCLVGDAFGCGEDPDFIVVDALE